MEQLASAAEFVLGGVRFDVTHHGSECAVYRNESGDQVAKLVGEFHYDSAMGELISRAQLVVIASGELLDTIEMRGSTSEH